MYYRIVEVNGLTFQVWFNYTKARSQNTGSIDSRLPDITEEIELVDVVLDDISKPALIQAITETLANEE